jgi:hypothetical protein
VKSIPFDDVAQRFTPLVSKDVTIGQLIEVADGVTKLYQARGYALAFAFITAQTFDDGVMRVTVVEGFVAQIKLPGNAGALDGRIRELAAQISADRPLRRATFERYINLMGRLPGVKVGANVPPPQTTDGATTLELAVQQKPFDVSIGIDFNRPGVQGLLTVSENGLTSLGEQLSVSALLPKGRDNVTYVATHGGLPIGSDGLAAALDASHYRGNPTDNPGLPANIQRTVINDKLAMSLNYPLILSSTRNLTGSVSGYASHDETVTTTGTMARRSACVRRCACCNCRPTMRKRTAARCARRASMSRRRSDMLGASYFRREVLQPRSVGREGGGRCADRERVAQPAHQRHLLLPAELSAGGPAIRRFLIKRATRFHVFCRLPRRVRSPSAKSHRVAAGHTRIAAEPHPGRTRSDKRANETSKQAARECDSQCIQTAMTPRVSPSTIHNKEDNA